ncbi:ATP-binding protein [bacterium]|nr:MAG: ATP-binding protein [bacterium]
MTNKGEACTTSIVPEIREIDLKVKETRAPKDLKELYLLEKTIQRGCKHLVIEGPSGEYTEIRLLNVPVSGEYFFGRESEIAEIFEALEQYQFVFLCGDKRVGKSSIMNELHFRSANNPQSEFYFAPVIEGIHFRDLNIENMLKELSKEVNNASSSRVYVCQLDEIVSILEKFGDKYELSLLQFIEIAKQNLPNAQFILSMPGIHIKSSPNLMAIEIKPIVNPQIFSNVIDETKIGLFTYIVHDDGIEETVYLPNI